MKKFLKSYACVVYITTDADENPAGYPWEDLLGDAVQGVAVYDLSLSEAKDYMSDVMGTGIDWREIIFERWMQRGIGFCMATVVGVLWHWTLG
jgi:hypothetical protein